MRLILGAILLFALWLGMSGVYKPLIIGMGAASALLVTFIVWRMEQANPAARVRMLLRPVAFVGYIIWLLKEIARANWAVTKAIMAPDLSIRQHFFRVPYSQRTEMGETIFANSITLTPGTLTVELEDNAFCVHALDFGDTTRDELADMNARVRAVESI